MIQVYAFGFGFLCACLYYFTVDKRTRFKDFLLLVGLVMLISWAVSINTSMPIFGYLGAVCVSVITVALLIAFLQRFIRDPSFMPKPLAVLLATLAILVIATIVGGAMGWLGG